MWVEIQALMLAQQTLHWAASEPFIFHLPGAFPMFQVSVLANIMLTHYASLGFSQPWQFLTFILTSNSFRNVETHTKCFEDDSSAII